MQTESKTPYDIVRDTNEEMYLPGIQRSFVWDKSDIIMLFDSIIREYSIGIIHVEKCRRDENIESHRNIREIITDYASKPKPDNGSTHRAEPLSPSEKDQLNNQRTNLIIDGQQRVTSLNIGLRGSWTPKPNSHFGPKENLCIDLLSKDDGDDLLYDMEFKSELPSNTKNSVWVWMSRFFNTKNTSDLQAFRREMKEELRNLYVNYNADRYITSEEKMRESIDIIHQSICLNNCIPMQKTKIESTNDLIRTFARHQEGTQLDKSELVLASLTDKWSRSHGVNARKEITGLSDKITNKYDGGANFNIKTKTIVAIISLSVGLGKNYNLDNFTGAHLQRAQKKWNQSEYQDAIIKTLDLLKEFGFKKSTISQGTVIPLTCYFMQNPAAPTSRSNKIGRENRSRIHYWICASHNDDAFPRRARVHDKHRDKIRNATDGQNDALFPIKAISEISHSGYSLKFPKLALKQEIKKDPTRSVTPFTVLSIIYWPNIVRAENQEVDHIFPKSEMNTEELVGDVDDSILCDLNKHVNSVANKQLLTGNKNRKKSNQSPLEWINSQENPEEYKERHLLPKDEELYQRKNFDDFINARKNLIVEHIQTEYENPMEVVNHDN